MDKVKILKEQAGLKKINKKLDFKARPIAKAKMEKARISQIFESILGMYRCIDNKLGGGLQRGVVNNSAKNGNDD